MSRGKNEITGNHEDDVDLDLLKCIIHTVVYIKYVVKKKKN